MLAPGSPPFLWGGFNRFLAFDSCYDCKLWPPSGWGEGLIQSLGVLGRKARKVIGLMPYTNGAGVPNGSKVPVMVPPHRLWG
jgi:hypothetical protein